MTYNTGLDQDPNLSVVSEEGQAPIQYSYQPPAPKHERRKPNGKYHFSPRTVLIPLIFFMIHYGIQTITSTIVAVVKLASEMMDGMAFDADAVLEVLYSEQTLILLISGSISILIYVIALNVFKKRNKNYVLEKLPSGKEIGASLGITIGMIGATTLLVMGMQLMAEVSGFWARHIDSYIELTQVFTDESNIILQILAIVVIIPIAEELLFRAIVCGELMRVFPNWAVILLSGLFFAVIHMNVVQSTYVLISGIALGAIYVWSRSLTLTIIMHSLFNFLGSSLPMLIGDNETVMVWVSSIEMIFVPVAILIAIWFYMKQKREAPVEV